MNEQRYRDTAKRVLAVNMAAQKDETLLVVSDTSKETIAQYFVLAGRELGLESVWMCMSPRQKSGEEPPQMVSKAMGSADIVLCITEHSLTHTQARKYAVSQGARVATMPGITMDMLTEGAITADYVDVERVTERVTDVLNRGKEVRIEKDGHRLTFSIDGRGAISSTGMFRQKSQSGNLPSGESYIAPLEGSANGTMCIDGSIAGLGVLKETVELEIKHGRLESASGASGEQLLHLLGAGEGRMLCEFGIGTNKNARVSGNVLEDEKVYGTIHLAFGSNHTFGGTINAGVHIDCVIHLPTVYIDDQPVMQDGEWLVTS